MKVVLALLLNTLVFLTFAQSHHCAIIEPGRINVVVFLATDCPISQKYIPTLNSTKQKYQGEQVQFQSLFPASSTKQELTQFKRDFKLAFAVKSDDNFQCARHLSARVTPEVFLFDMKGDMVYRGAIDNWFYDLGRYRQKVTETYLIDAIDALLAGQNPSIRETTAVGCAVNSSVKKHGHIHNP